MIWKPNVTVAAIVERAGKFLLVEEQAGDRLVLNQPAGHLERDEGLLAAVSRETLEETAWHFTPEYLVGVYQWPWAGSEITYLRFCFGGVVHDHEPERELDSGIKQALWLAPGEIAANADRHRSPQVQRCLDDYLAGRRYPLSMLIELPAS